MNNDATLEHIYGFICDYWRQFGYSPTLVEIAEGCFISKPNLYRYLDRLEIEDRITRDPGRARSIKLLKRCPDSKG